MFIKQIIIIPSIFETKKNKKKTTKLEEKKRIRLLLYNYLLLLKNFNSIRYILLKSSVFYNTVARHWPFMFLIERQYLLS